MKKFYLLLLTLFSALQLSAANITIIQPASTIYTSDTVWKFVATGMGHNASIVQDTILDNTFFFTNTDVLILPVYDINYTAQRKNNIVAFMQTGKSVYLQSEYDLTFNGNQAYQDIVASLGGSFSWNGTVSGVLAPMNVLGTLAVNPITIPPLTYFWYGCDATVCNFFESFLEFGGQYFGFTFCPPGTGTGRLMTTSDQDWIIQLTSLDLMQNMLTLLLTPPSNCGFAGTSISLGNDTSLCTGDHLLLGSGISATSYLWSTGATSAVILVDTSATYWLQVTSGGCTAFDTIVVNFSPCTINAAFVANDTFICPGTCTDFTNLSVNASSYIWSFPGGIPSVSIDANPAVICYNSPGSYDVSLIVSNGTLSDTLVIPNCITVYPFPLPQGIVQSGDTLTANQGAMSYQWFHDGTIIQGATNYFYIAQMSGNFNVVCTDVNGCEVEAAIFDVVAGLSEEQQNDFQLIFPNPVGDYIDLNLSGSGGGMITIFNVLGETVFKGTLQTSIDVSGFSKGMYVLEYSIGHQNKRTKFIKQ